MLTWAELDFYIASRPGWTLYLFLVKNCCYHAAALSACHHQYFIYFFFFLKKKKKNSGKNIDSG